MGVWFQQQNFVQGAASTVGQPNSRDRGAVLAGADLPTAAELVGVRLPCGFLWEFICKQGK